MVFLDTQKGWVLFLLAASFTGCATFSSQKEDEVRIDAPTPGEKALSKLAGPPEHTDGSLWADTTSRPFLFLDLRASHVGDLVTVKVSENAKGEKETETKTARKSNVKAATKGFFGKDEATLAKLGLETEFDNKMDGAGSTSRSGTLIADVPSVITSVLPNGNLVIEGVREIRINGEKEVISLKGIIRPEDIGAGNTIASNYVADAMIEYSGRGVLNDKNHPGWGARILDWVWPF